MPFDIDYAGQAKRLQMSQSSWPHAGNPSIDLKITDLIESTIHPYWDCWCPHFPNSCVRDRNLCFENGFDRWPGRCRIAGPDFWDLLAIFLRR